MTMMKPTLAIVALAYAFPSLANSIDSAKSIEHHTNRASAKSQQHIDRSAEATIKLKAQIEQLQQETKNLRIYRDHLNSMVESQQQEMTSLDNQIAEIKTTRQGIVPLMYDMLAALEHQIEHDKPLRRHARVQRVDALKKLMPRADVSDAEKFRRILEAYQIEMDYGTKLGTYQGRITLNDDTKIEAQILYLGRVSLVARNLAGSQYWTWNAHSHQWQVLDSDAKEGIDNAFDVANKKVAPTFLSLPVSLTPAEAK
ncbi:DUF3450 domain-containing protein [Vibrio palustris]|nr:DUF3450 domain-containing protein [Vibrio palustris]